MKNQKEQKMTTKVLSLNKLTIANLKNVEMNRVYGGYTTDHNPWVDTESYLISCNEYGQPIGPW